MLRYLYPTWGTIILLTIWHSNHFLTLHCSVFLSVIFCITWSICRRIKTFFKETYCKMNSVQTQVYWRDFDSYVHYFSTKTSLQYLHGNKISRSLCQWRLGYCQLKRCCLSDELTSDSWTVQCRPYKSGALVLKRSAFQFLIGRTTARAVLRASIHMTVIYSLRLLRCLLRSIIVFRIFIALVLFRFASFSPVVLNGEIMQKQRHLSMQII